MCGIIGYSGPKNAAPIITSGLKYLEYRGYDSVGIAILDKNHVEIRKDKGMVEDVSNRLSFSSLKGNLGIGHSRWATHGGVCLENSHPHYDCNKSTAIVHNGVIENYLELKNELLEKENHNFSSETDSEVIAHLFESNLKKTKKPLDAFAKTISSLKGSFAICLICKEDPKSIFLARKNSPLVIGKGKGENFCASDFSALIDYTRDFVVMNDEEICQFSDSSISLYDLNLTSKPLKFLNVDWDIKMAEKSGYPHFMLKEIAEQPDVVISSFSCDTSAVSNLLKKYDTVHIIASGTSYHASLVFSILLNKLGKNASAFIASEYQNQAISNSKALIFAITQSGETADVLQALRFSTATDKVCLTNVQGSTVTRLCNHSLFLNAGPESSVAATKTFLAQLCLIYKILFGEKYKLQIQKIIKDSLSLDESIRVLSSKIIQNKHIFFLSRGLSYPLALEGALKLKEISYLHAQAYPAGELKHGTLSLIEKGVSTLFFAPNTLDSQKLFGNLKEVKARGSTVFSFTDNSSVKSESDLAISTLSTAEEILYPFCFVVPLQLLAYYSSVSLGINPDRPRNLAKSVTVE